MELQIRSAQPADAAVIALLGRITFAETFGHLFVGHEADLTRYLDNVFGVAKIERSLDKTSNAYWLAALDRLPVGYAKLKIGSAPPGGQQKGTDQLQKIYVLRSFLGQGIGAALMQPVIDEARQRASFLWLDVLRENARAIEFYRRFGFHALGEDTYAIGAQTFQFYLMGFKAG
jgi:ribosomal protein S18 acetylase RimI-like enzyme